MADRAGALSPAGADAPRRRRLGWLGAYAVATFLSFPHPLGEGVIDWGLAVSWLGPALLLLGLEGLGIRRAARWAFLAGLVAHSAILHWIYVVTVVYGHAPPIAGALAPVLLASYIAGFTAAFGALVAWLSRRRIPWVVSAPLVWTGLDQLRAALFTGFPWATLGYAQHQNALLMALAPYTGVYGLSFATALGGAALAQAWRQRSLLPAPLAALLVVGAAHLPGLLPDRVEAQAGTLRVAVLQGNIDQGVKWDASWFQHTLSVYEDLSRQAAARGARVVVWPESAIPVGLDGERAEPLRARLAALARETGAQLVVGSVGLDFAGDRVSGYFDSAFLVEPSGHFSDRYDKAHLVPFGEYVPLRDWIGRVVSAVARGVAPVGVSPGPGPRSLVLSLPDAGSGPLSVGVPICYELIFPDLVRRFVQEGAGVLLAITNDAWYGRTGAPYQFLAMTALRSAESRVWTARAANTGVSAFIDARGRVRSRTRIFERDLLVADVPYRPPPIGGSFYARRGDVFAWACWIALAVLGLAGEARKRSRGR